MSSPIETAVRPALSRDQFLEWFHRNRARSRALFDLLSPDVYYDKPISLRHPIVFYEGHLPAFNVITLLKRGLGRPGVDETLERLFARGIDPGTEQAAAAASAKPWPSRETVHAYAEAADRLVAETLAGEPIEIAGHPVLERAEGVHALLEHEAMHQETLLYMWHRLPLDRKQPPPGAAPLTDGTPPAPETVRIPAGRATLGARRDAQVFGWDNEFPSLAVDVPAFEIDVYNVTNAQFLEFVEAGGYQDRRWWREDDWEWVSGGHISHPLFWERDGSGWVWRAQFARVPLPPAWPVYVSHAEASAYARWRGRRLPTEAEFHRAAYGTPDGDERPQPWGDAPPDASRGNFDFVRWDPVAVGSYPAGVSAWGVHDLVGNGWEWTSTIFAPFPGFAPMPSYPEYSADFFDGSHYVLKGASPVTARELVRRSFRNWFRPQYPYVYATFRTVSDAA